MKPEKVDGFNIYFKKIAPRRVLLFYGKNNVYFNEFKTKEEGIKVFKGWSRKELKKWDSIDYIRKMHRIEKGILKDISPTKKEDEYLQRNVRKVMEKIRTEIKRQGVKAKVMQCGSTAKGTHMMKRR